MENPVLGAFIYYNLEGGGGGGVGGWGGKILQNISYPLPHLQ